MKKLLAAVLLLAACNQQASVAGVVTFNEEAEKAALMKTITAETETFYSRDYEGWKQNFVQAPYAFQGWSNGDGTFAASTGWVAIDKRIGDYIKSHPLAKGESYYHNVQRKNMIVKFFSDSLAYLSWDQYNGDKENKWFTYSKDQRIMQKQAGRWMIANVSSFWDYKNKVSIDSLL